VEPQAPLIKILVEEDVWLEGGHEYVIRGEIRERSSSTGYGLFVPDMKNLLKREIVAAHAIVNCSSEHCPIRIMYMGSKRLHLYNGTCLGTIEPVERCDKVCRNIRAVDDKQNGQMEKLEKIFQNDLCNLPEDDSQRLRDILREYQDVFSISKFDVGLAQDVEHHIDTGDALPIVCNPRRVPLGVEEKVDELVENLLQNKIIRPSRSPWNAPIVVVTKKNGDIRMCVDYRKLNSVTSRPIFPIPDAQQLFDTLDGSSYFSTLDLSQGYHQVPVAAEDIQKTAFTTRRGQFEYLRMPFGLCSAPATFQMLMHTVLRNENWVKCLIYLDDVLIFGKNIEEHDARLRSVLQKIREAGLKLSPEKCHLFQKEVAYLGHIVSSKGIQTSREKIEKVNNFRSPSNGDELRSFLGLCGYYRRYIKDYALIVAPLEKLCLTTWTKKVKKNNQLKTPWNWTGMHEDIFKHLKWCLTNAPILAFPTKDGAYILDTDASHDCVGAVLSQVQAGEEKVIAYASNKLSKTERGYCITRKELLAVYKYVLHFKHYLYGRKFTVRTDHQALTWLLNWKKPNTSQYCTWRAELECYDMEVLYRPGKLHGNADALSRLPQCEQCELKHDDPQKKRNFKILSELEPKEVERVICKLSKSTNNWTQEDDGELATIIRLMKAGKLQEKHPIELQGSSENTKRIWERRQQLRIRGGILYLAESNNRYLLLVPQHKRSSLIAITHQTLAHVGITKTLSVLKQTYWWPGMETEVRLRINMCKPCAERKCGNMGLQPPAQQTVTGFPFEKIAIDITGPLPQTQNGYRYILGVIDYFSRYPMLIPLRNVDARTVAESLFFRWISIFGAPHSIHSDRGTCFESSLFKELCDLMNIKKTRTAPYYPKSDGLIERLFRTVKDMIYATMQTYKREWNKVLPVVEMGLRGSIQSTTRISPHEVVFGHQMRTPISWMTNTNANAGSFHRSTIRFGDRHFYSE
jgi:transposase InsO family protein